MASSGPPFTLIDASFIPSESVGQCTSIRLLLALAVAAGLVTFILSIAAASQPEDVSGNGTIKVPDDYSTIQAAIDAAGEGDTIMVTDDTYTENLSITKGITLSGGWNNTFTDRSPGDTYINGNNLGRVVSITCITSDTVVTIDGFTIMNGDASGLDAPSKVELPVLVVFPEDARSDSAASQKDFISPAEQTAELRERLDKLVAQGQYPGGTQAYLAFLDQLDWRSKQAQQAWDEAKQSPSKEAPDQGAGVGGGVYSHNASLKLLNNAITNNIASQDTMGLGGGVYISQAPQSAVRIYNNTFRSNTGCRNGEGRGGALYVTDAPGAIIEDNNIKYSIASNFGDGFGGAAYIANSTGAIIEDNLFAENTAIDADGQALYEGMGGGLMVYNSPDVMIDNNEVERNTANAAWYSYSGAGGGIFLSRVDGASVQNNLFQHNLAALQTGGMGGGMHLQMTEDVHVTNNQFIRNWAAIYMPMGSMGGGGFSLVDVYSSTVKDNQVFENTAIFYKGENSYGGGILGNKLGDNVEITDNLVSANIACYDGNFGAGGGIQIGDSEKVIVADNIITGNVGSMFGSYSLGGGMLFRNVEESSILRNLIQGNTAGGDHSTGGGLVVDSFFGTTQNILVDSNLILDNQANTDPTADADYGGVNVFVVTGLFTFTNNVVAGNRALQVGGMELYVVENANLVNNTFVNNGELGIHLTGGGPFPTNLTLENNIVVSHTIGISISELSTATVNYTLWHGNDTNITGTGTITHSHPVTGAPAFVNPQANDFHITVASAARESGNPSGAPPAPDHDADGNIRPHNQFVDLGAYEYQGYPAYLPIMLRQSSTIGWVVGDSEDNYGVILHTRDGGQTWVRQGSTTDIPNVSLGSVAAIDPLNAWVVGGSAVGTNPGGFGVILRTRDGGQTWQRQGSPAEIPDAGLLGIYALDGDTAWAAGLDGVIVHTTDGGQTWTQEGQGLAAGVTLQGTYASDVNNCWIVGSDHDGNIGTVLRTTNGGATWNEITYTLIRQPAQPYLIMVHGVDADTVWVSGSGQASHTTDGGATWIDQWFPEIGPYHVNGVFALNRDRIWLAVDDGMIFRSDDGGYNYVSQDSGTYSEIMRIYAIDEQNAWAVTSDTFPPFEGLVLGTTDGGQTWVQQTTPVQTAWSWVSFVK